MGNSKWNGRSGVGALVGGELARNSLWALGIGIFGILIYVTFRFELSFAVGAIVALLHDVLMTVGVFSLMGRELTLTMVGAVLTIAGYSINDTIVVYDRIREGLASGRRGSIEQIMNESINQTLSRTILTSSVTLIRSSVCSSLGARCCVISRLRSSLALRSEPTHQSSSLRRSSFGGRGRGAAVRAVCGAK
jgi:preprotein translocase SecF subunit